MHLAGIVSTSSVLTFVMKAVQIRAELLQTKCVTSTGRHSWYLELEFILECTKISVSITNFPGRIFLISKTWIIHIYIYIHTYIYIYIYI